MIQNVSIYNNLAGLVCKIDIGDIYNNLAGLVCKIDIGVPGLHIFLLPVIAQRLHVAK